jgi:hypothetical protein
MQPTPKAFASALAGCYNASIDLMKTTPDDGRPTFIPENTRELSVGEKIENGDLKWHQSANEWTEIQTLGYRTVKAPQRGLYRRRTTVRSTRLP